MAGVKIIPDLTISEQGVGPAQDVWPDTAAGSGGTLAPATTPGAVGVEGPAGANVVAPAALFGQVLTTLGPPATPTTGPLQAEWISPLANPTWTQLTWFIDPANSTGLASDSNSGIDAAHPVLTFTNGVAAKWGTYSPKLGSGVVTDPQTFTMTWMSSQTAAQGALDPVILTPLMNNSYLIVQGVLGAAQQLFSGVLGAVTPKNRAAGQILTADLGFAAPIGALVVNTTHPSRAWTYVNTAGTTFEMTQPMRPMVPPLDAGGADVVGNPSEVDTWAPGDAITIYQPVAVNIVLVSPVEVQFVTFDPFIEFGASIQLYTLTFLSPNGLSNNDSYSGNDTNIIECTLQTDYIDIAVSDDETVFHQNSYFSEGVFAAAGANPLTTIRAGAITPISDGDAAVNWNFDFDVILDATAAGIQCHKLFALSPINEGQSFQGLVCIVGTVNFYGPWQFFPAPSSLNTTTVWGPGTFNAAGSSRISYGGSAPPLTATETFQNLGGLRVNEQTNALNYTATDPAVWHYKPLTVTNLDTGFPAGLGGQGINPGGAAFTSQGTS